MSQLEKFTPSGDGLAPVPAAQTPAKGKGRGRAIAKAVAPAEELRPLQTQQVQTLISKPLEVARQAAEEVDALTTEVAQFVYEQYQASPGIVAQKVAQLAEANEPASFREPLSAATDNARSTLAALRAEFPTTF